MKFKKGDMVIARIDESENFYKGIIVYVADHPTDFPIFVKVGNDSSPTPFREREVSPPIEPNDIMKELI